MGTDSHEVSCTDGTGGPTRTVTHIATRSHRHKVLEWHAGQASHAQEHAAGVGNHTVTQTHRGQMYTQSRMRTAAPSPLGPSLKALGGSRRGWRVWVSFSTVSGLSGPRGAPVTLRPAVARTCGPHRSRYQPPQTSPSARPARTARAHWESCGSLGSVKNYNSQKVPRCACTLIQARSAGVRKLQLPEGRATAPSGMTNLRGSGSPRRAGRLGAGLGRVYPSSAHHDLGALVGGASNMGAGLFFLKEGAESTGEGKKDP